MGCVEMGAACRPAGQCVLAGQRVHGMYLMLPLPRASLPRLLLSWPCHLPFSPYLQYGSVAYPKHHTQKDISDIYLFAAVSPLHRTVAR